MKIEILVSHALINQDTGRTAGLHERVDAPKERAEYLVEIGAARAVDEPKPTEAPQKAEDGDKGSEGPAKDEKPAQPARKPATPVRKPAAK